MNLPARKPVPLRFSMHQQAIFARRLSLYLHSGMPITRALSFIYEDAPNTSIAYILTELESTVSSGLPLSQGLARFPKQFGIFSIGFVQAGEFSGTLSETFSRLAVMLSKREALTQKVLSALIYPTIILIGTVGITLFLILCIFPKILPVLQGFRTPLPFTTRVLIGINTVATHDWLACVGIVLAILTTCIGGLRFKQVKRAQELACLRLPLCSSLYRYYAMSVFTRTLSLQLKGGVRILPALTLTQKSMSGILYTNAIEDISREISQGKQLSAALRMHPKLFPMLVCQMVSAGEATGTVSTILETLATTYEESLDDVLKNITVLIEPFLMISMGFVVGFVALAIITPIYAITQNLTIQ